VCIPTVRPGTLGHAVASIVRQTHQDWDLTVVGQGDEEPALRAATALAAGGDERVRYVHIDGRGASVARNAGANASTGEAIAFMDDDCEADAGWLAAIDVAFTDDVGFVCGSVVGPPSSERRLAVCPTIEPDDVVFDPEQGDPPPGFGLLGANMAVRRLDAQRVGSFDECMGPGSYFQGGEEHDYLSRLAALGVRAHSTPRSIVHHTYGVRYGVRAVYSHKRERIRGDGAVTAKGTLLGVPRGGRSVRGCVVELARVQLATISLRRLPLHAFRQYHFLMSYRECLRGFGISSDDRATAVLVRRPASATRATTSPLLRPPGEPSARSAEPLDPIA
jgi:glycosyltransferase involved in cell wall biosynthesis